MLFSDLFSVLEKERRRYENFKTWQRENLPEFNGKVLTQKRPSHIYPSSVAWKFDGEVDRKVWQPVKGWDGYYEPNKRTKAGKAIRERIDEARGEVFSRWDFFDMFKIDLPPYGKCKEFILPTGFFFDDSIYMFFDDGNYDDICKKCAGLFVEISKYEFAEKATDYGMQTPLDIFF